jgi:hypothetical protein
MQRDNKSRENRLDQMMDRFKRSARSDRDKDTDEQA